VRRNRIVDLSAVIRVELRVNSMTVADASSPQCSHCFVVDAAMLGDRRTVEERETLWRA